jgi:hypothetical protein
MKVVQKLCESIDKFESILQVYRSGDALDESGIAQLIEHNHNFLKESLFVVLMFIFSSRYCKFAW